MQTDRIIATIFPRSTKEEVLIVVLSPKGYKNIQPVNA